MWQRDFTPTFEEIRECTPLRERAMRHFATEPLRIAKICFPPMVVLFDVVAEIVVDDFRPKHMFHLVSLNVNLQLYVSNLQV